MPIGEQVFENNRRYLWAICYRMTGNSADADDIVQETFVRALNNPASAAPADEAGWRPWLVHVAVNICRDQLRRRRRRGYTGPWLPTPIADGGVADEVRGEPVASTSCSPEARYELYESISCAFLTALEALTPAQRAVLLLRDVFDYSTEEAAQVLQMTTSNIKVTLHRARKLMRDYERHRIMPAAARQEMTRRALERFLALLADRDIAGLESLLAEDAVVISDGGGEVTALLAPMQGRDQVLRLLSRLNEVYQDSTDSRLCRLNGEPAILFQRQKVRPGHAARYTLQCELDTAGHIHKLFFVFAPSKLTAV